MYLHTDNSLAIYQAARVRMRMGKDSQSILGYHHIIPLANLRIVSCSVSFALLSSPEKGRGNNKI
jgi:hypothetical protein